MPSLTAVQKRAVRMLDEEGSYGRRTVNGVVSPNWYHDRHRPGNLYVDWRTANVLIEQGLAEARFGRLCRTEAGTALARSQGSRRVERSLP